MKWVKQGKVFDPVDHKLPNNCVEFAQSPQTLVFDKFVRVYFSTRALDTDGRSYLSHISYADFQPDFRKILSVSDHVVMSLGGRGCFDEHGIFPMNILRNGNLIFGYTSGVNRRQSVPVDTAIGLAISRDQGRTFQRISDGPILAASLHEPCLVADPFVMIRDGVFHMWYIFGAAWKQYAQDAPPDRIYKISHATSTDGITWKTENGNQIIDNCLGADECQALPTVIEINSIFHMFFCYRQPNNFRQDSARGYRIGHAISQDLVTWTRRDDDFLLDISDSGWDSEMLCYPHVFQLNGDIFMLYNGNNFGRRGFGLARLEE